LPAIFWLKTLNASFKTLDKIAKVLGVPVTELIEDVPDEQE
jgi:transcriptional regulator with XRE-family HTH domain